MTTSENAFMSAFPLRTSPPLQYASPEERDYRFKVFKEYLERVDGIYEECKENLDRIYEDRKEYLESDEIRDPGSGPTNAIHSFADLTRK